MPSLLTLSDVYCTGHHGAVTAGLRPGHSVSVIGDGAVGLCGVLAAKRLGAEQIILMGRHQERTDLGREFGATDVVAARGEEGIERVLELTRGDGTHAVLECVGTKASIETAVKVARSGGAISRIGVPQYTEGPLGLDTVFRNVNFTGGAAPARAYIEELMPDILDGTVEPGRVFDRTVGLDEVPDGYKAMAERESLKVLIRPEEAAHDDLDRCRSHPLRRRRGDTDRRHAPRRFVAFTCHRVGGAPWRRPLHPICERARGGVVPRRTTARPRADLCRRRGG